MHGLKITFYRLLMTALGLALVAAYVRADEITLKNGDHITGDIVSESGDTLLIDTEALGVVSVEKEFVAQYFRDGQAESEMTDQPGTQDDEAAPEDEVVDETSAVDEGDDGVEWTRKASLGYVVAGGNTENEQANVDVDIQRKTEFNEWSGKFSAYMASQDDVESDRKFYEMLRYAYSFSDSMKWYHFTKIEATQDKFANIENRMLPSSGVGYWFADEDDWKLMSEVALGYEYTMYRDDTDDSDAVVLIPRGYLMKKFGDAEFSQDLTLYPSLSDVGEFRVRSETALTNPINDRLAMSVKLIDEYNSDPPAGIERNDYRLITSLDVNF